MWMTSPGSYMIYKSHVKWWDWPDGEVAITLEVILRVSCSIQDRVANIIVQQFCIYIFNLGAKEAALW